MDLEGCGEVEGVSEDRGGDLDEGWAEAVEESEDVPRGEDVICRGFRVELEEDLCRAGGRGRERRSAWSRDQDGRAGGERKV